MKAKFYTANNRLFGTYTSESMFDEHETALREARSALAEVAIGGPDCVTGYEATDYGRHNDYKIGAIAVKPNKQHKYKKFEINNV